ncbi:hypothetical protein CXZ10_05940 [Pleomorphomonas diazotrophica]|uniref:Uncharacterized protein n=1 Tax=Pleomorphomonas diazotrophica TaxID=1166257 RepID=A0A1I4Q766_9HYPH|nr:hypothetical protein [Pleomorphomonas diazotrophica]PKR90885.1 hypothetical protein CXZ10_05940 [Pleomorphomonas diazotrophica]SFM35909.1 hypothetical protein SAMN05192571_101123 [Pleomorphomonas diazotrophica]
MADQERMPTPWTAIEHKESFEVRDASGQTLAYIHFEDELQRRRSTRRISKDMARRLASQICKLPGYITKAKGETL